MLKWPGNYASNADWAASGNCGGTLSELITSKRKVNTTVEQVSRLCSSVWTQSRLPLFDQLCLSISVSGSRRGCVGGAMFMLANKHERITSLCRDRLKVIVKRNFRNDTIQ